MHVYMKGLTAEFKNVLNSDVKKVVEFFKLHAKEQNGKCSTDTSGTSFIDYSLKLRLSLACFHSEYS